MPPLSFVVVGVLYGERFMKIGDKFIEDSFGEKLEYIVDSVNADGSYNAHLNRVIGQEERDIEYATEIDAIEATSEVADAPVEAVEKPKPKTTTTRKKTTSTKTTTRKKTTTKK